MKMIYTLDSETDPFKVGRNPQPFAWDLFDGVRHFTTWGKHCTDEILNALYHQEPGLVYIHNGGKFDVFYLLPYIDTEKDMLIIKERITQCFLKCSGGYHKVRDSLKILPFSLDTYQKTKIDYAHFEPDVRESFKDEIVSYLQDDTRFLYDLVFSYIEKFGPSITIGSTAMKELKKFHNIGEVITADVDAPIRERYFLGGRVERFQKGVFPGEWKCYDVNSMYPFVMANFYHPIGPPTFRGCSITPDTYFVTVTGFSRGAFPVRDKHYGVMFPHSHGMFSVTIHEYNAAIELGLFDLDEVLETVDFSMSRCFVDYVTHFYNLKSQFSIHLRTCQECNEKASVFCDAGNVLRIDYIFYKFLLNNSYGRFAINPDSFKEYRITGDDVDLRWHGYDLAEDIEGFNLLLWSKPSEEQKYMNIATGASITGAARSVLLRGLHGSTEPIYCDTDSIICKGMALDTDVDASRLGAWKLEKTGDLLAIAGRKMYALFKGSKPGPGSECSTWNIDDAGWIENLGTCVKWASKGVKITPSEVVRAASGEVITYVRDAPTYRLNGSVDWITRRVRMV